jgi:hypothetical protein
MRHDDKLADSNASTTVSRLEMIAVLVNFESAIIRLDGQFSVGVNIKRRCFRAGP